MVKKVYGPTGAGDYMVTKDRPNIHLVLSDGTMLAAPVRSKLLRILSAGASQEIKRKIYEIEQQYK